MMRIRYRIGLGLCGVAVILLVAAPTVCAKLSTSAQRYDAATDDLKNVPYHDVALVFGAGVLPDGEPTDYLKRRVGTAVKLYQAGRVRHLLVSGDNSSKHYNEPAVMKRYAIKLGVSAKDITEDFAGLSTYDSCYRARAVFGVRDATLVTQGYHLPRAVMTCKDLGVQSVGVAAIRGDHRDWSIPYVIREYGSTLKAVAQITYKPKPTFLGKFEPIKP